MIVIHIARKPLAAGNSVAANVLKHGTGVLNIDGCRISGPQGPDRSLGPSRTNSPLYGVVNRVINPQNSGGRFPTNLILQHLPECDLVGEKKVRGTNFQGHPEGRSKQVYGSDSRPRPPAGYADASGKETVPDWDCVPGCPVAELNGDFVGASRYFKVLP